MLFIEFLRLMVFLFQIALQVTVLCAKAVGWFCVNVVVPGLAAMWSALCRGTARAAAWWNESPTEDPVAYAQAARQRSPQQQLITAGPAEPRAPAQPRPVNLPELPPYVLELWAEGLFPYYVLNGERSGWWVEQRPLWPERFEEYLMDGFYIFYAVDGPSSGWQVSREAPWLDPGNLRRPAEPFTPTPDSRPI